MQSTMLTKHISLLLHRSLPPVTASVRSVKTEATSSGLVVRKVKTETDNAIIERLNQEFVALGWKCGAEDLRCYLNSQPGLCVAELNGDLVGSIVVNKYNNIYSTVGLLMVLDKYREQGYSLSLVKVMMKEIQFWSHNVSTNAVPDMIDKYQKFAGFQPRWYVTKYAVELSNALKVLKAIPQVDKGLTITDLDLVDEGALLSYDSTVFGYQRDSFILAWLNSKGNRVKVALDDNKDVVGYIVARPAFLKQDGYCLRPLFAESTEAAQALLTALFEEILLNDQSSSHTAYIDCPNINASIGVMKLLNSKPISNYVFMSTKDVPKGEFIKWYGRP